MRIPLPENQRTLRQGIIDRHRRGISSILIHRECCQSDRVARVLSPPLETKSLLPKAVRNARVKARVPWGVPFERDPDVETCCR